MRTVQDCAVITDYDLYVKQLVAAHAIHEGAARCLSCGDLETRDTVIVYTAPLGQRVACYACGMDYPLPTQALLEAFRLA